MRYHDVREVGFLDWYDTIMHYNKQRKSADINCKHHWDRQHSLICRQDNAPTHRTRLDKQWSESNTIQCLYQTTPNTCVSLFLHVVIPFNIEPWFWVLQKILSVCCFVVWEIHTCFMPAIRFMFHHACFSSHFMHYKLCYLEQQFLSPLYILKCPLPAFVDV